MLSEARTRGVDPLALADQLLYSAKQAGRNRFAAALPVGAGGNGAAETFGDRAARILDAETLRIEIQPIAEAGTGRVSMGEALTRVAADEDPIPPGLLVGEIERAGLGQRLDVCVLRKAIALLPDLRRAVPGFRLTVNVSGQSLRSSSTAHVVLEELARHGVDPEALVLELTETAPVEDFEAAREAQRLLQERGVMFAIDDFGVGSDPYRCLKELDFGMLKIAGEFVKGMADDESDAAIVWSLVMLARERGMDTVAEFVADERVFDAVREAGVSHVQGYHIGRSLPPADFIATHLGQTGAA